MPIVDLTQTIVHHMQVFPGDDPAILEVTHTLENDGHANSRLSLNMHTGTHIDGPQHMIKHHRAMADMPMDDFIGTGCAIDISKYEVFDDAGLIAQKAQGCTAVLFYTGLGQFFGTPRYTPEAPYVGVEAAKQLVRMKIKLFGIDAFGPDPSPYLTHHELFNNNILIAENLTNIDQLIDIPKFELIALPLKIKADSAPARIIARF
jgi:kynurenine formamidase